MSRPSWVLLASAMILCMGHTGFGQQLPSKPWLDEYRPTRIEWVALELQATEGDVEFGENDITVNFYLGLKSFPNGVIYCDLAFLPTASASMVQVIQQGIRQRFQKLSQLPERQG